MGYDGVVASNEPLSSTTVSVRSSPGQAASSSTLRRPRDTSNNIVSATLQVPSSATPLSRHVIDNSAGKSLFPRKSATAPAPSGLWKKDSKTEMFGNGRLGSDKKHRQFDQMPPPGG